MAECMGLNRDGSKAYNLNPLDTHVRRLIWHQLCFLDIRTCEAQGPKPAIRREDYDTWLPDNFEEDQLANGTCPARPCEGWTSNLLPLIRFEINEMMRIIWNDRRKLESRRTTLTQVLFKIEKFRKHMLENYDRLLDERVPIQRYAKLVMHLLMYRLHVMILHPYYANTANPMPQRLRSVLIMSAMVIIELAMQLDTNPAFRLWRWYGGAYQQYQAALILATEMFYHPNHKDASRIWVCLDYVFALECDVPMEEKGRQVLAEIMGKMGVYMSMRKMRAPTATANASPAKQAVKTEDDEDDEDDSAVAAAASILARAGVEQPVAPPAMRTVQSPLFEQHRSSGVGYHDPPSLLQTPQLQAHHRFVDQAQVMMKQEPGTVPTMSQEPISSSAGPFPRQGTTTPSTIPVPQTQNQPHHRHLQQYQSQQQQQQQQMPPSSAPIVGPPPPLSQQRGETTNPNMMMEAMMTVTGAAAATTRGDNNVLWSLPQTPAPPISNNTNTTSNSSNSNGNPESPGNSSLGSDGGSIDGPGPFHHQYHHHRQVGGGNPTSMALGGSGPGGLASSSSSHLLDSGDWVSSQWYRVLFLPVIVCAKFTNAMSRGWGKLFSQITKRMPSTHFSPMTPRPEVLLALVTPWRVGWMLLVAAGRKTNITVRYEIRRACSQKQVTVLQRNYNRWLCNGNFRTRGDADDVQSSTSEEAHDTQRDIYISRHGR